MDLKRKYKQHKYKSLCEENKAICGLFTRSDEA